MKDKRVDQSDAYLLALSSTLDELLTNQQENPNLLNSIEDWIKTHYHRIQLQRNNNDRIVTRSLDKQEMRVYFLSSIHLFILFLIQACKTFFPILAKPPKRNLAYMILLKKPTNTN